MKKKLLLAVGVVTSVFAVGFIVLQTSPGDAVTATVSRTVGRDAGTSSLLPRPVSLEAETPRGGLREEEGRVVVEGALPPHMEAFKREADAMARLIDEQLPDSDAARDEEWLEGDRIMAAADALIEKTNREHAVDAAAVEERLAYRPPVTDPELIEINEKFDALDRELMEIERDLQ